MDASPHASALSAAERSAWTAPNREGDARYAYDPEIDVLTVTIGRDVIEDAQATWFGGYLTQNILVTMPTATSDRMYVGIASPKDNLARGTADSKALEALTSLTVLGGARGVMSLIEPGKGKPVTAAVTLADGKVDEILTRTNEVIGDIAQRDLDPNFVVRLTEAVGITHDPLLSLRGRRLAESPSGIIVADGDLTADEIGAGATSELYGSDGFPQRTRLATTDDIVMPKAPNTPSDMGI